jgi:hypothetical protein
MAPYASVELMPTAQQLDETVARLRAAGGTRLFLDYDITIDEVLTRLRRRGFEPRSTSPNAIMELVDERGRRGASHSVAPARRTAGGP